MKKAKQRKTMDEIVAAHKQVTKAKKINKNAETIFDNTLKKAMQPKPHDLK